MQWISLFLLAFAVSIDGFSVGLTYGLRKMKIPFKSIVIISCCSAITLLVAMSAGYLIQGWLSPVAAEKIGGLILIVIGSWVLYQVMRPSKEDKKESVQRTLIKLEIKSLGVVIQILRKPTVADFDDSGTITGIEAILLGTALSLDAFGAGIGASLVGYSPLWTAVCIAIMSSAFVMLGLKFGNAASRFKWVEKLSFLPGFLLIVIGVFKI
ncbi:sporulation membrane protein YtaF [Pseudalkalibacillus caeni]|uniref:Sporulation membrane protein YtaF n=1 Tax=Exobacillus caeni TaxID=2574798 RepID=A0A5R9F9G0_9BACL|nr:sporulation membrane protein YtaF [Pseudalkalibacillus caeni]TLS39149.1 sporulation membrane protein YtaF [Pseudalkalibacillus caeni]